ncbi:MAG: carboxypeptidase-like regulatory domain-containing protein [Tannerella sp.]|jgi:hypothetical protein|nr:carboxypeptidase-like regulatory domain-containing protein [Tannerella sp.]
MSILDYIKGNRRGKAANRIERAAMEDPFLREALEGYDAVPSNEHAARIKALRKKVTAQADSHALRYWSIAASLLLLLGLGGGGYLYLNRQSAERHTEMSMLQSDDAPQILEALHVDESAMLTEQTEKPPAELAPPAESKPRAASNSSSAKSLPETASNSSPAKKQKELALANNAEQAVTVQDSITETEVAAIASIKGKVIDENGDPMSGASVVYRNTNSGATTNIDGYFELPADTGMLMISFIGYEVKTVGASDLSDSLLIAMQPRHDVLDEVTIVAFGTQKRNATVASSDTFVASSDTFSLFVQQNMIRPNDDCRNVKGEVILSFSTDSAGRPTDIKVINSLCATSDAEAIRLIKIRPSWNPGLKDKIITIKF